MYIYTIKCMVRSPGPTANSEMFMVRIEKAVSMNPVAA